MDSYPYNYYGKLLSKTTVIKHYHKPWSTAEMPSRCRIYRHSLVELPQLVGAVPHCLQAHQHSHQLSQHVFLTAIYTYQIKNTMLIMNI